MFDVVVSGDNNVVLDPILLVVSLTFEVVVLTELYVVLSVSYCSELISSVEDLILPWIPRLRYAWMLNNAPITTTASTAYSSVL